MAHAWKACWVQALGGSNPPSSATEPRDRFRFRGFCCLWRRWCSGRHRARPPARSPHASFARSGRSRSPPVPSGPSGARHTGGACRRPRALLPGLGGSLAGVNRAAIALPRPGLVPRETCVKRRGRVEWTPGLDPTCLDPEALDDLRARERGKDLARHEELRTP